MSCNVIAMPSTLTTSFDAVKRRYVLPSKLCDPSVVLANNSFVFRYRGKTTLPRSLNSSEVSDWCCSLLPWKCSNVSGRSYYILLHTQKQTKITKYIYIMFWDSTTEALGIVIRDLQYIMSSVVWEGWVISSPLKPSPFFISHFINSDHKFFVHSSPRRWMSLFEA